MLQEDIINLLHDRAERLRDPLAEEEAIASEFAEIEHLTSEEAQETRATVMNMLKDAQK